MHLTSVIIWPKAEFPTTKINFAGCGSLLLHGLRAGRARSTVKLLVSPEVKRYTPPNDFSNSKPSFSRLQKGDAENCAGKVPSTTYHARGASSLLYSPQPCTPTSQTNQQHQRGNPGPKSRRFGHQASQGADHQSLRCIETLGIFRFAASGSWIGSLSAENFCAPKCSGIPSLGDRWLGTKRRI
jgi:hypothetical protein